MKAPSTNIQAPGKIQIPNFNRREWVMGQICAWCLVLIWSLELGAWSFSQGARL
jgi:hypothetical protein